MSRTQDASGSIIIIDVRGHTHNARAHAHTNTHKHVRAHIKHTHTQTLMQQHGNGFDAIGRGAIQQAKAVGAVKC